MVEASLFVLQVVVFGALGAAVLLQQDASADDPLPRVLTAVLALATVAELAVMARVLLADPGVVSDDVLVFGSFVVLAGVLAFAAVFAAASPSRADASSLGQYALATVREVGPGVLSLEVVVVSYGGLAMLAGGFANRTLNYGVVATQGAVTPAVFFAAVAALFAVQTTRKLRANGVLTGASFEKATSGTAVVVLSWLAGYTAFVGPVFVAAQVATTVDLFVLPLDPSHVLLNVPYLWAGLVAALFFAVDVDLE